jgi:hypothetical protein
MKLFQGLFLFLMTLAISVPSYAIRISIEDQLDENPKYIVPDFYSQTISVDFAEKGIQLGKLKSTMAQYIDDFTSSDLKELNIAFLNISTKQQLKHIDSIFNELKDDYDARINVWELDYKDTALSTLQKEGDLMYEKFIEICAPAKKSQEEKEHCNQIKIYQKEQKYRSYERAARADERREDFEESQGFGSSGWMGDEYFESSDEEEYY